MTEEENKDAGYSESAVGRLELIWGEGFLSPGGPAEVSRILGNRDIGGCEVLDIGCGVGGADLVLVRQHGAKTVVGIDVQKELVDLASNRSRKNGLEERIKYQLVNPGPLLFADQSFDIVFSKDAIIHVQDKKALFSDIFRILRPGGWIMISDWLAGEQSTSSKSLEELVAASGHNFKMVSLREIGEIIRGFGFIEIELSDRNAWYLEEATAELQRLHGLLRPQFLELWGEDATNSEIEFWEILVKALKDGSLRPSHIRARKPGEDKNNLSD